MFTKEISPWQCIPGDIVLFSLKQGIQISEDTPLTGTVITRSPKRVTIKMSGPDTKVVTVHISCVKIIKPAPRLQALKQKFRTKEENHKRTKDKEKIVRKICGMSFTYAKKSID